MNNKNKIGFICVLALLLIIPVPDIVITIFFSLLFLGLTVIYVLSLYSLGKKRLIPKLPDIILYWILSTLGVMISCVRNIMTTECFEEQNKILRFAAKDINGVDTYGSIPITILIIAITFINIIIVKTKMKDEFYNRSGKESKDELLYFINMQKVTKVISGTVKAAVFVFVVALLGSTLTHVKNYEQNISDVIKQSLYLSSGLTNMILIMMSLCCMCINFFITVFHKED